MKSYGKSGRVADALAWALAEMPTDKAKEALQAHYVSLAKEDASESDVVRAMAGAVLDGLNYGNWPEPRKATVKG